MHDDGKVTYKQNGEGKLSSDAQQLANAIDDHSVIVTATAENTKETSSGNLYIGGAFMGNEVTDEKYQGKNIVKASQEVNPEVLNKFSEANGKAGKGMLHEVTEGYQGGLISQGTGISSPRSNIQGSVYPQAHSTATKQPGTVNRRLFNKDGLIITPQYLGNREIFTLTPKRVDYISNGKTIMSYP
ncbi:hypothetical protein [Mesonia aestuariivivens]|uniref:hypothetical protein n=1 Tax=Mesonia aestuariivivens TaxID=2796128 RepID=UPI0021044B08|nr:hypothetical protein [Mesonia aestuariivivens]